TEEMLKPTLHHVTALADLVRKQNARFVFLYLPMPFQLSDRAWDLGRKAYRLSGESDHEISVVKSFCAAQGLDCLFANQALQDAIASEGADKIYYRYDFHPTVEGNRVLGIWLGEQLERFR